MKFSNAFLIAAMQALAANAAPAERNDNLDVDSISPAHVYAEASSTFGNRHTSTVETYPTSSSEGYSASFSSKEFPGLTSEAYPTSFSDEYSASTSDAYPTSSSSSEAYSTSTSDEYPTSTTEGYADLIDTAAKEYTTSLRELPSGFFDFDGTRGLTTVTIITPTDVPAADRGGGGGGEDTSSFITLTITMPTAVEDDPHATELPDPASALGWPLREPKFPPGPDFTLSEEDGDDDGDDDGVIDLLDDLPWGGGGDVLRD